MGSDTLVYFHFALWEATMTAVSSDSPLCSQIFTLMCFLFFSSAGSIEILEIQVEEMLVSYTDRPRLISKGGA